MNALKKLDERLEKLFKELPSLPEPSKEALTKAWPWIALIFGILQLFAVLGLWNVIQVAEKVNNYSSYYVNAPGVLTSTDRFVIYLGMVLLMVDAIILLMAYPELKKRTRRGWNLLLLGALLNLLYSIIAIFISDRGLGSFLFGLIGSFVGFYLLYQVKSKFGHVK